MCEGSARTTKIKGASAIKCCYAAAGSGSGAEETGLRAPVRQENLRSATTKESSSPRRCLER